LVEDGVQEMDMVINIGKVRSGDYDYVREEIKCVREVGRDIPLKVILETSYLSEDMIKRVCGICIDEGADFVKTGTGWAPAGTTIGIVKMIKDFVGNSIKIKASGGIRDLKTMIEMCNLGVDRFGINVKTSIEIIENSKSLISKNKADGDK
jgi:deoxyribose-phosphate aldolase